MPRRKTLSEPGGDNPPLYKAPGNCRGDAPPETLSLQAGEAAAGRIADPVRRRLLLISSGPPAERVANL
jgi:hypothetical protein